MIRSSFTSLFHRNETIGVPLPFLHATPLRPPRSKQTNTPPDLIHIFLSFSSKKIVFHRDVEDDPCCLYIR